jgi:hypothetical protein
MLVDVTTEAEKHPDWTNQETINYVISMHRQKLKKILSEQHPKWTTEYLNKELDDRLPGTSAIQKKLPKGFNWPIGPEDALWSFRDIAEYPISPESLPTVMRVWEDCLHAFPKPLSIRDVCWISRIYPIFKEGKQLDNIPLIYETARSIALYERLNKDNHPLYWPGMSGRWVEDGKLYLIMTNNLRGVFKFEMGNYSGDGPLEIEYQSRIDEKDMT